MRYLLAFCLTIALFSSVHAEELLTLDGPEEFHRLFQQEQDHPRLVLFISPT